MTDRELEEILKAGDIMAECLGRTIACMERRQVYKPPTLAKLRRAIIAWHRMKAIAKQ